MGSKYKKIVLIGSGSLLIKCIKELKDFDIPVTVLNSDSSNLSKFATFNFNNIKIIDLNLEEIFKYLKNKEEKTIVFSVVFNHIIPKEVVEQTNLTIINYHNSLLPNHRGRNAEAWSIFQQDQYTGITWHLVDSDIDTGDIIIQKELQIEENITSIKLLKKQSELAFEAFQEILPKVIEDSFILKKNIKLEDTLHLSNEIPNNGVLNLEWNIEEMKAFLNSMNYGVLNTLGKPKVKLNGEVYEWEKVRYYDTVENDHFYYDYENISLSIIKNQKKIKLIGLQKLL